MNRVEPNEYIIAPDQVILITGATGFIGSRVVKNLLDRGFTRLRCFTRPSSPTEKLTTLTDHGDEGRIEIFSGNLLSKEDCAAATKDAALIINLAAGRGEKSFPDAFMNSVVTTRNLLEASLQHHCLKRFVNISSFAVYSNRKKPHWRLLDESCPVEVHPELRGDAYAFAKIKQDQIVTEYAGQFRIPYVIVRPGYVFGPGNPGITGRVGTSTFGVFLHLGGSNKIPFTYVDNCADAIVLAGLKPGVDGEVFNIVDDNLPTSRQFLRLYKRNVRRFRSIFVPHFVNYALCYLWEKYSAWSKGQLEPAFNRKGWHAFWKRTRYTNEKLKRKLGWTPHITMSEGLMRYFESSRNGGRHA
jgi:nucleoside-diphosphate-sugar epimerase